MIIGLVWLLIPLDKTSNKKKKVDTIGNMIWKPYVHSFTKENINNILEHSKMNRKIGILSIDVDGNDYWIWENITYVDPIIVIIEFNSNFGFDQKISVPYKENFIRAEEHHSNLYWGASLEALKFLAQKRL